MIHVLHLITGLTVGGAEMMLFKLVSNGGRGRVRHGVVTLWEGGAVADRMRRAGISVGSLGMARGRTDPRGLPALVARLRRERPDVVQTWMYHANLLGTIGARLAGTRRLAWNVRTSDFVGRDPSRQVRWISRACALLTRTPVGPDVALVNSRAGLEAHAAQGYRPRRWEVIPNGFDLALLRPDAAARRAVRAEIGAPAEVELVGHLGRFDPMKDQAGFLRAAAAVRDARPETHFLLAGGGVDAANPALSRLVDDLALRGCVHLLGERADAPRLLAALDVLVSSSSYGEGFSNVIGEAMACGVPCVVTDVGDSAAIVGETGAVVPPRDPVALGRAVVGVLARPPRERAEMGEAARERVRDRFAIDAVVRRYESLYEDLAAR